MSDIEVELRKGETVDKALKRLKKRMDRNDVLRKARERRHHITPSEKKKELKKRLKFQDYLRNKYRDL